MNTLQVNNIASKLLGSKFIGVYPLNKLPNLLTNGGYIVNTQSSELPGEHWLAFTVDNNQINVFDPYGYYYPSILVNKLHATRKSIIYNRRQYDEINCGQLCISWLYKQLM